MMSEIIERFRYRFQLWRREQREDWRSPPGTHLLPDTEDDPDSPIGKLARRPESISTMLIRSIGVYFCIIIILAQIGRLIGTFVPAARFAIFVVFAALACLWTLMSVTFTVSLYRAKKRLQARGDKSSNPYVGCQVWRARV
jgi:hypothetical protein